MSFFCKCGNLSTYHLATYHLAAIRNFLPLVYMPLSKAVKREIEVAFAKHAQPVWLRILKYIFLACLIYFFWGNRLLWIILPSLLVAALTLHFWYRHKTHAWTKSYGGWDYEKNKPHLNSN